MVKSRKLTAFIAVWIVSFLFSCKIYAQEESTGYYVEEPRIFYGGLVAGANFCQVDGDYYAGYHKIGANFGGIVYAQLKKHIALSMEILYSEKGSKSNYVRVLAASPALAILKYGINTNYAEIPVMLNYFDKRKSHFGVGLSYSQLVGSTETIQTDPPGQLPIDLSKYPFKKSDINVLAGAQLHLVKGLFLNVRFQYSVVPFRTNIPPDPYARSSQYQNLWVVRFMYLFI